MPEPERAVRDQQGAAGRLLRGACGRVAALVALGALLAAPAAGRGGQPQEGQQPPLFRADVDTVLVDVNVQDSKGRFVRGLTADDFRVYEEGEEVEISFFALERFRREVSEERVTTVESEGAGPPGESPVLPRYLVLFLDGFNTSPSDWSRVREHLLEWLRTDLQENDRILVAALTPNRRLVVAPQFTRDPEVLAEQVQAIGANPTIETRRRSNERRLWELLFAQQDIDATVPTGGDAQSEAQRLRQGANLAGSFAGQRTEEVLYTLDAMTSLAAHLDRSFQVNGPKVMVMVSSGISQHPGSNYLHIVSERMNQLELQLHGTPGTEGLDPVAFRSQYAQTVSQYMRRAVGRLNRLNYILYTLSAEGSLVDERSGAIQGFRSNLSPGLRSVIARESQDGLIMLAKGTGGLAFYNSEEYEGFLSRIDADTAFRYVLGYQPPEHDPEDVEKEKFYEIRVETSVPDVDLRARQGYVDR